MLFAVYIEIRLACFSVEVQMERAARFKREIGKVFHDRALLNDGAMLTWLRAISPSSLWNVTAMSDF